MSGLGMFKYTCTVLFVGICLGVNGENSACFEIHPRLQRKGIFAGMVWTDAGLFRYAESTNRVEMGESRIRLLGRDNMRCEFEQSFALHTYTKEIWYTNSNQYAESVGTQSVTRCSINCEILDDDWQPQKFGIPVSEDLLLANLNNAVLTETYLKPVFSAGGKFKGWFWISVNVFHRTGKICEGFASISVRSPDGKSYPMCIVAFNRKDKSVFLAQKFALDIAVHPYIDISNQLMTYVAVDGLETVVLICGCVD